MDKNAGRRLRIVGDEHNYNVYTVEPDGEVRELPCRSATIVYHSSGLAEAIVYFTSPELNIEAPRASDGVRAG